MTDDPNAEFPPAPAPWGPAPGAVAPPDLPPPVAPTYPGYAPHPGYGGYGGPGGYPGYPAQALHRPGIIALRPLGLGDIFDGAFKAIRRNPRTMIGMSVVVMTAVVAIPAVASLVLAATGDLGGLGTASGSDPAPPIAVFLSYAGQLFGAFAGFLLTGLLVHVVAMAVVGKPTTSAQAWTAVRGRLVRLVGLILLGGFLALVVIAVAAMAVVVAVVAGGPVAGVVVGLVVVPLSIAVLMLTQVRLFLLAPAALVLENVGILESTRRARVLSRGQFWRLFGIYLLVSLVAGFAAGILSFPFTIGGTVASFALDGSASGLIYVFSTYLGLIISQAISTPFTSAAIALMYIDQRIRKEGFDIELMARAGIPTPAAPYTP